MPGGVLLAYRFAHSVLAHDPEADPLRERVVGGRGERGLMSPGFAIAMACFLPTAKSAPGHGQDRNRVAVV